MPCNHNLEAYLDEHLKAAEISGDFKGYLFRTAQGKPPAGNDGRHQDSDRNHTFRATGITQYLRNGGRRELAQQMAAHESPRTTALYDRRDDEVAVDEVERILIRTKLSAGLIH
jgi:integrase